MSDSDFARARDEFAQARRQLDAKRGQSLLAREAIRQTEAELASIHTTPVKEREARHDRLAAQLETHRATGRALERQVTAMDLRVKDLLTRLGPFTDPRTMLPRWSDDDPILLLPLRLETRFLTLPDGDRQLCVRVYPDTCLIDTFEPSLTDKEVASAQTFWAGIWAAGGDDERERTAWRELVAAHGSGRSAWLVREYLPLNPNDKPGRDARSDVLLIITPGAIDPAIATYWRAVWVAGSNTAAVAAAKAALTVTVGEDLAEAIDEYKPVNFDEAPVAGRTRADVQVKVAFLGLTPTTAMNTRRASWSSAARVDLLPERLVLVAYPAEGAPTTVLGETITTPLATGPDPGAPKEEQLQPDGDALQIPAALKWIFDFDAAIAAGMGFRLGLTAEQAAAGFRRIVVVGVRGGFSASDGAGDLATLLEHHLYSRGGLQIIPQGTPSNNTEKSDAGYTYRDDADTTFKTFFKQAPQYSLENDPRLQSDGQRLAGALRLPHDLVQRIPHAGGLDYAEASAMHAALWPATGGYWMTAMLSGVFSSEDIDKTRSFFTRYVTGRGPIPALRIGAQPYGILPTTAFDRIGWFSGLRRDAYGGQLFRVLKAIDQDWAPFLEKVSYLGKPGVDAHQVLLDVLGLHPNSVEYHALLGRTVEQFFHELTLEEPPFLAPWWLSQIRIRQAFAMTVLRNLGYTGNPLPDLMEIIYHWKHHALTGPVIDDRPLSETAPIRPYLGEKNYIEWLVEAAQSGITAIAQQTGFTDQTRPTALLYLLLRHALQLGFNKAAAQLQFNAGAIADLASALKEPAFVHVRADAVGSESRYAPLLQAAPEIDGLPRERLGDRIARNWTTTNVDLTECIEAMTRLARLPTARLERLLAEHIDCFTYRLDAWKTGLVARQLERRHMVASEPGLLLGTFGWLEDVRPAQTQLTPAELPADLAHAVAGDGAPPQRDSRNQGLIHAPSLDHANTAAVLRSGYVATDGRLSVNLSSRRVRLALEILEGMRNGQSLGALLGYQFERHVHDHGPLTVRALIYPLRRAFPLAADQFIATADDRSEAQDAIAAMNVVDGRKLVEQAESAQAFDYPFGVVDESKLPRRAAEDEGAMTAALAHVRDINDAVADLILAEAVHQAALGNHDASAGVLDAFAKGAYPPEPAVIRTPRSGTALTHRLAIHFAREIPETLAEIPVTPLAEGEPRVDAWLASRLPPPNIVGCSVSYTTREDAALSTPFVSQTDLGLRPLDLLYRASGMTDATAGGLDELIIAHVQKTWTPAHDRPITIHHTERIDGRVTWFELQPLLRSLRTLLVTSRPLQPADVVRSNDATVDAQQLVTFELLTVTGPRDRLTNLLPTLAGWVVNLNLPATTIDEAIADFAEAVVPFSAFRLEHAGTRFAFEWRAQTYGRVTSTLRARVAKWDERLQRYDAQLVAYAALPNATPEAERTARLRAAEITISTRLQTPEPANAAAYVEALTATHAAFVAKRDALAQLIDTPRATLSELLDDAKAELPIDGFDSEPLSFVDADAEVARFREQLRSSVTGLQAEVTTRLADVAAALAAAGAASSSSERVARLRAAARILLGEDFNPLPSFTLPDPVAAELGSAWERGRSGDLIEHLTPAHDFPLDDWMHGVARVREKVHALETAVLVSGALGAARAIDLVPIQLPFDADEPWLGLEVPDRSAIGGDRLLYTLHADAGAFNPASTLCGVAVDEWSEVIPGVEETTGIAFHYDRPNSEAPQSWLLAIPAAGEGAWSWDDLLGAVNDALDAAKKRALEPEHIENSLYGWFLPATTSAFTVPEISISNNLLHNIRVAQQVTETEAP